MRASVAPVGRLETVAAAVPSFTQSGATCAKGTTHFKVCRDIWRWQRVHSYAVSTLRKAGAESAAIFLTMLLMMNAIEMTQGSSGGP